MRKLVTVGLLSAVLASIVVGTAAAVLPKPKPWQWKPTKVVTKLTAAKPINGGEIGSSERVDRLARGPILSARCTPKGRGVAGRYSRFTCDTRYGSSNGRYTTVLSIRVLPVGTGKLCIVTVTFANLPGEFFALDASSGKPGPPHQARVRLPDRVSHSSTRADPVPPRVDSYELVPKIR